VCCCYQYPLARILFMRRELSMGQYRQWFFIRPTTSEKCDVTCN